MRFKGVISHEGMRALERQFLPCLEKFGKQCYLLLTPTDVYLLQDVDTTDGLQVSARLENVRRDFCFKKTPKNSFKIM
jgi:HUS1 checkpoint protein